MTSELAPIDVRQVPGLARFVEEVLRTRKRRRIVRDDEDVAVLIPPASPRRRRSSRSRPRGMSITEQTAGIFKQYRLAQPLTPRQEREAFEQGVADEVAGTGGG
jgi:hypothetical protein